MAKRQNIIGTAQKAVMRLPQLILVMVIAGIIGLLLGNITSLIAGSVAGIGDLGVSFISAIIALTVFTLAMSMKKGKFNLVDLIPLLIISPLVVAILSALNLGQIPVLDSTVELGSSLGLVVASVILSNNVVRQFKLFR